MAGKKIGIVLALDGEREFKSQITQANKSVTAMKSEMKLLTAEYEGNANSLEALSKKHQATERILGEQTKKYEKAKTALAETEKKYKTIGNKSGALTTEYRKQNEELKKLEKEYEDAQKRLQKMTQEGNSSERAMQKQKGTVAVLEQALKEKSSAVDKVNDRLTDMQQGYEKCGNLVNDWKAKLNNANSDVIKTQRELNKYAEYMREAESATDKCATSIDKFGKSLEDQEWKPKTTDFLLGGVAEAAASKGMEALAQGIDAVKESMYDLSSASSQLAASTGLSESAAKRYQAVMKTIKGDNLGEDYRDIADAMSEVIQIMGEMDDGAMKDVTESAITLRDTFGMEVNESVRAVDVMMKTMGVDATQAFDLIVTGAQNGLNRSGELVENITEYGQLWGQAGFSAEQMFAILENGLDSGAYNLDKVNDYVKEFGVSLADGRIEKNIGKFSDGTKSLFESWKNGEASTSDVFYSVINDLSEMTNQQEALTIASEVWSALGEDNAMQVLTALDDVNDKYKDVKGSMESLKDVKYNNLESAISGLGSALQENIVTPIADAALPAITSLVQGATDVINGIGEALAPQKSEVTQFVEDVQASNDKVAEMLGNAAQAMDGMDTSHLEVYRNKIVEINDLEDASGLQKHELQQAVNALAGDIPQLAAAWDTETEKINLSKEAITALIDQQIAYKKETAASIALQETYNAKIEAEANQLKINSSVEDLEKRVEKMRELNETSDDFLSGGYGDHYAELLELEVALDNLKKEQIEANKAAEEAGKQYAILEGHVEKLTEEEEEAGKELSGFSREIGTATREAKAAVPALNDAAQSVLGMGKNYLTGAESAREYGEASAEAVEKAAETAKEGAEAQKEAFASIQDAYNSAFDSIREDLKNKISLSEKFDGGEDTTTEQINEALQSQLDGMTEYRENLEKVRSMTDESGKAIFSPEVMAEIEAGGTEYANILKHMVYTWEEQGEYGAEQLKGINEKWSESLDMSEDIARVSAANQTAYQMATGELGSSELDFANLTDSIDAAVESAAEGWKNLPESTRSALEETIKTAQECGVKIPDGLTEGIESGEISPEKALASLQGSLKGSIESLAKLAKDNGIKIDTEKLVEGVEAGGQEAIDAFSEIIGQLSGKIPELQQAMTEGTETDSQAYERMGEQAGDAIADGIRNSKEDITQAFEEAMSLDGSSGNQESVGTTLAQSIADGITRSGDRIAEAAGRVAEEAAKEAQKRVAEFRNAGTNAAAEYAKGIAGRKSEAIEQARQMAAQAIAAVRTYQSAGYSVGYNISAGVAAGIRGGSSAAINAAAEMARQALAAAKKEADIHSPSRKFQKEFGEQIPAGAAFGIKIKSNMAAKEAENMSKKVFSKASAWLEKYRKKQNVSLADEKYFWKEVAKRTKEGTSGYKKAMQELQELNTKNSFGVSWFKNSGKKKVKKDAEEYYSDVYDAAQKNLEKKQDMSLKSQKKYWENVLKQLKKGTQGYRDAQAEIAEINAKIGTVGNMGDVLSNYKVYWEMSERAEVEYWDTVRKNFAAGTQERIEADEKYFDAKEKLTDKLKELEEEYADSIADVNDRLKDEIDDLNKSYQDALDNRTKAIKDAFGLFDEFESESADGKTLLFNIKTQAAGYEDWMKQLETLSGKGILDASLIEELKEQGPEMSATLHALNSLSREELEEYNAAYLKKLELSQAQAEKDNAALKESVEAQTKELTAQAEREKAELAAKFNADRAAANAHLSAEMKTIADNTRSIAEDQTAAIVAAIRETAGLKAGGESSTGANVSGGAGSQGGTSGGNKTSGKKDKVLDIINSGADLKSLSKKEKEGHHDLFVYIQEQYKKQANKKMYKDLGAALGISVSSDPKSSEKDDILKKLKKKGYRSGGRGILESAIWMDEELDSVGPELVVSRRDNAMLTRIPVGSDVIDAHTTDNLIKWGKYSPDTAMAEYRTKLVRQQAAAQEYMDTLNHSGIVALNRLLDTGTRQQTTVSADTGRLEGMMENMMEILSEFLPHLATLEKRQTIVLDSGKVVGETAEKMGNELAMRGRRRRM